MSWGTWRKGSKASTEIKVGVINGRPTLQSNWGGRIYGVPLYLTGAGSVRERLEIGDLRATGNITFGKNSKVYNNSNRLLMVGGLTASGDNNMTIGTDTNLSKLRGHADNISNIAIGIDAIQRAVNARFNIAIGDDAMGYIGRHGDESAVDTSNNVAIGHNALKGYAGVHSQAYSNVAIGYLAMNNAHRLDSASATTNDNVCIGGSAGAYASADSNVYIGQSCGVGINTGSAGSDNVGVGYAALNDIDTGVGNVSVGHGAGDKVTTGNGNIILGQSAGDTISTGSYNISMGYESDCTATNINQIAIGFRVVTDAAEQVRIGDNGEYMQYDFSGAGGAISWTSDIRVKKDIVDTDIGLEFINKLRPVKFVSKNKFDYPEEFGGNNEGERPPDPTKIQDGLIAQEVKATMDELDVTFSGWVENEDTRQRLDFSRFTIPIIKAVQEMSAKFDILEERVNNLEAV